MGCVYMVAQDDAKQSREREGWEEEGRKVRQEGWSKMSTTLHKLSNACLTAHGWQRTRFFSPPHIQLCAHCQWVHASISPGNLILRSQNMSMKYSLQFQAPHPGKTNREPRIVNIHDHTRVSRSWVGTDVRLVCKHARPMCWWNVHLLETKPFNKPVPTHITVSALPPAAQRCTRQRPRALQQPGKHTSCFSSSVWGCTTSHRRVTTHTWDSQTSSHHPAHSYNFIIMHTHIVLKFLL